MVWILDTASDLDIKEWAKLRPSLGSDQLLPPGSATARLPLPPRASAAAG
eukprot:CAMPEP_0179905778 /NCGR_PEP_ID=MMETSP0982-20121206/42824_1 /TAXON_ID=483367 /ORGANISM="non described non described, Strain CCMP 2436" /LENGTH=49 /DNA_ID= /DNA_START= /DNA_END= /DNA_ORIENTATION=